MLRPCARLRVLRALVAGAAAAAMLLLASALSAQQASEPAELGAARMALDRIDASFKREGSSVQALFELGQSVVPVRAALDATIADLEPRAAQVELHLEQLGPAPASGAPPESASIVAERARLGAEFSELDAHLKQARLLTARADELAEQIAERRRSLHAQQLFVQSPSILSPFFWIDAAKAFGEEAGVIGEWLKSTLDTLSDHDVLLRAAMAAVTLAVLGIAMAMLWRWWQRRVVAPVRPRPAEGREGAFARALASIGAFVRIAVTGPLTAAVVIAVLDAYRLLSDRWFEIAFGLGIAVAVAALGRAVASGVFAAEAPWRRLVALDDQAARTFTSHLVWGARSMAALLFLLVVHKVLDAAPVLTIATSMLFALAISGLLLHLLLFSPSADIPDAAAAPRAQWLRAVAWLVLAAIIIALIAGYAGFAAFLATRLLTTIAIIGVLYLLLVLTHTALVDRLDADAPRSRAIAASIGVNPRRLGLIANLLSGIICMVLIVGALVLVIGPLEATSADFQDTLRRVAAGFRIGELNVSFAAFLTAVVILLVALIVTRALQAWLERQILPRTELEPSLQQSIAAIFGYVGIITAIVLALSQLGIDLQKVALIAGALSVGIGFGLQSIVSNFISGLILLTERPIRVGDLVVVKGEEGHVRRIRVRATEIETADRASVIIPNAEFITGPVKNRTHANATGRIIVKVGVGYDSDPDRVRGILLACADEHPRILKLPAPGAFLLAFGDKALEFELRAFVDNVDAALVTRSDLHFAILRRFRATGIVIPHPQSEVRLRQDGES